jgi:hypothetical protein
MNESKGSYGARSGPVARKLGSCTRCMRLALTLALCGWAAVAVAAVVLGGGAVVWGLVVAAGGLSALFAAHVVAFLVRSARWWQAEAALSGGEGSDEGSRRRFLVVSGMVLGGALLAPVLRAIGSDAVAQQSVTRVNCQAGPHWAIDLTAPPIVGCGAASEGRTAGQNALADFLRKVRAACRANEPQENKKGTCEQRKCKKVQEERCVVRTPAGNDFKGNLELRAKQPGDPCPAAATHVLVYTGKNKKYRCTCDCE